MKTALPWPLIDPAEAERVASWDADVLAHALERVAKDMPCYRTMTIAALMEAAKRLRGGAEPPR